MVPRVTSVKYYSQVKPHYHHSRQSLTAYLPRWEERENCQFKRQEGLHSCELPKRRPP